MDWVRFLEENNIHHVDRGPNTKRGEVSIHCPMCGPDDPSEHLGINLQTGKWGCLRDGAHRGKSARTLIKFILGCSSPQAGVVVKQYSHSDPDTLEGALAALEADSNGVVNHEEDLEKQIRQQKLGPQFNDFSRIKTRGVTRRFFTYLQQRGYDDPTKMAEYYDLRCALTGRYKDRIIIPVRLNDELLGWTSRTLATNPINAPRYLASSEDVKTTIYNFDKLKEGGEKLFIVEGPFDAIKLDYFFINKYLHRDFQWEGCRATCTFGTSVTISQIALLRALSKKYNKTFVLFDKGAEGPASELADWVGARMAYLPSGVDDPGDLTEEEMMQLKVPAFGGTMYSNRPNPFQRAFSRSSNRS